MLARRSTYPSISKIFTNQIENVLLTKESQSELAHPSNHARLVEACTLITKILGERNEKGEYFPIDKAEVMLKTEDVILRLMIYTHWVDIWSILFPLSQNSGHSPMNIEDSEPIDCDISETKESVNEENICFEALALSLAKGLALPENLKNLQAFDAEVASFHLY